MSTATELRPLSLAERIAKVRGRMLVATLTKVPPSNKDLFVALCQIYEQHKMERASFSSELSDESSTSPQEVFLLHEKQRNTKQQWPECMLIKNIPDGSEDEMGFDDWDKSLR